jgi:hypothetical protein
LIATDIYYYNKYIALKERMLVGEGPIEYEAKHA